MFSGVFRAWEEAENEGAVLPVKRMKWVKERTSVAATATLLRSGSKRIAGLFASLEQRH